MVEILSLLITAVIAVLISMRLGLGSQLGYLAAGAVIGPFGIWLITDAENLRHIGEFGVVFLLFMIGLEIKPKRLWVMRHLVLGYAGIKVALTGVVFAFCAHMVFAFPLTISLVISFCMTLSSTAFGMQLLSEQNELTTHHSWNSFGILFF